MPVPRKALRKKHSSLRVKILLLIQSAILLLTVALAAAAYFSMGRVLDKSTEINMNLACENEGHRIDETLMSYESVINHIADFIDSDISGVTDVVSPGSRHALTHEFENMFRSMIESTDNTVAGYVVYDQELIDEPDGIFYSRGTNGKLRGHQITDLRKYEQSDTAHTGWYYIPKEYGKACWLEPYYNRNLEAWILSYEVPVIRDGQLLCIVGMDLDFGGLLERVASIRFLDSGYAFLKSADGRVHYNRTHNGVKLSHGDSGFKVLRNEVLMSGTDSGNSVILVEDGGAKYAMTFVTLRNGLKLVFYDSVREIYGNRIDAIHSMLAICLGVSAIFTLITLMIARTLTRPLEQLATAANQLAHGDFNVALPTEGSDEIEVLSSGLQNTAQSLKKYTEDMTNLALKDSLTGVKNKTAYQEVVEALQREIDAGTARFAVVMTDVNGLKRTNDIYGHEAGDRLIQASCNLICKTFGHSPVFRIGGDEFAVILKDLDYACRNDLCTQFALSIAKNRMRGGNEPRVSIAIGMATFDPEKDRQYSDTFKRADDAMYEDKRVTHAAEARK